MLVSNGYKTTEPAPIEIFTCDQVGPYKNIRRKVGIQRRPRTEWVSWECKNCGHSWWEPVILEETRCPVCRKGANET